MERLHPVLSPEPSPDNELARRWGEPYILRKARIVDLRKAAMPKPLTRGLPRSTGPDAAPQRPRVVACPPENLQDLGRAGASLLVLKPDFNLTEFLFRDSTGAVVRILAVDDEVVEDTIPRLPPRDGPRTNEALGPPIEWPLVLAEDLAEELRRDITTAEVVHSPHEFLVPVVHAKPQSGKLVYMVDKEPVVMHGTTAKEKEFRDIFTGGIDGLAR